MKESFIAEGRRLSYSSWRGRAAWNHLVHSQSYCRKPQGVILKHSCWLLKADLTLWTASSAACSVSSRYEKCSLLSLEFRTEFRIFTSILSLVVLKLWIFFLFICWDSQQMHVKNICCVLYMAEINTDSCLPWVKVRWHFRWYLV